MKKLSVAAACVALSALAVAPAHAAVTFVSAKATSNASALTDYSQADYGQGFGTKSKTVTTFTPVVTATAGANAVSYADDGVNTDSANALEQPNGYFTSSANGIIDLTGITSASTYGPGETAEAYSEGQSLGYTFSVDTASVIDLSYNLSETYTGTGSYAQLYLGSPTFSSSLYNSNLALNTSGSLSFDLSPGTYLLNFYSQIGDDAYATDGGVAFGSHSEELNFNISPTPEPQLWAMMMLSVGLAGLVLRRRWRPGYAAL